MELTKDAKLIGKGSFTKCYKVSEKEVLLVSRDPVKLAMSEMFWPKSRRFPKVEKHPTIEDAYLTPYLGKTQSLKKGLNKKEYELYRELRRTYVESTGYCKVHDVIKGIKHPIKKLLLNAADVIANYRDIRDLRFEISSRNVRVKNGKLVLMDCFYFSDLL